MTPPSPGLLDVSPVVPVATISDPAHAVPVARALLSGGIPIIELTLRTQHALEGLSAIAAEVPDILLGAGSVLTRQQADLAAVASPVPQLRFCPTGDVTLENLGDYLALPNVGAVGGSWITPAKDLAEQNWRRVSMLARDARRRAEASCPSRWPSSNIGR